MLRPAFLSALLRSHLLLLAALFAGPAHGAEVISVRSGPAQTHLLELFTSEGCSSCPPAERAISALRGSPRLWKDLVPIAFHVDYWDNLGWKDALAAPAFTARQRRYAQAWGSNSVYTPAFVFDGREWRGGALDSLPNSGDGFTPGLLQATLDAEGTVTIAFNPTAKIDRSWTASAALLGSGLESKIKAGENSGRVLQHDFVVRIFESGPMTAHNGEMRAVLRLPLDKAVRGQSALAVWITESGKLNPIQAAGGPF
jgi:hypothetical protein